MTMAFKLSTATQQVLATAAETLRDEVAEHRSEFDDKSERWREGDAGTATEAWLDELDNLVDTLDNLDAKPES
jgi:uncharacterized protein YukE